MKPQSKNKYGIMWEDENALVTPFCDTEAEAWEYYDQSGESRDGYYCREFTPKEQKESESWPEI